jgi:hypothetical protein
LTELYVLQPAFLSHGSHLKSSNCWAQSMTAVWWPNSIDGLHMLMVTILAYHNKSLGSYLQNISNRKIKGCHEGSSTDRTRMSITAWAAWPYTVNTLNHLLVHQLLQCTAQVGNMKPCIL